MKRCFQLTSDKFTLTSLAIILLLHLNYCTREVKEYPRAGEITDEIFQYYTWSTFSERKFDGNISFAELKKYGNFGIGTFNALDGEMLLLYGALYKFEASGNAIHVPDDLMTPFATVKYFVPDDSILCGRFDSIGKLNDFLQQQISGDTLLAALLITGRFDSVVTRSIPRQERPYPEIEKVVKAQVVSEFKNIDGILVGFYFPPKFTGINFPGFHFHFITGDMKYGGHLIDCKLSECKILIDKSNKLLITL